jgi:hypothetical protein
MTQKSSGKTNAYNFFLKFFSKWIIWGLLIILLAFLVKFEIIPTFSNSPKTLYFLNVLHYMFYSVGISLIIASFFTFSIESETFISYIEKLLKKIIISKDFLSDLEPSNKKEALSILLNPSDYQLKLYSNVDEYFQEHIERSLRFFDTNFKSNLHFKISAKYDENKSKIRVEYNMSFRVYKAKEGYQPIVVGYAYDSEVEEKLCEIKTSDGSRIIKTDSEGKLFKEKSGFEWFGYKYEIPEEFNTYSYLSVFRKFVSYSESSSFDSIFFTALDPTDGITVNLICHGDITIKDYMIFDDDRKYTIDLSEDKKTLDFLGNHWLQKKSGFSILVARDN